MTTEERFFIDTLKGIFTLHPNDCLEYIELLKKNEYIEFLSSCGPTVTYLVHKSFTIISDKPLKLTPNSKIEITTKQ